MALMTGLVLLLIPSPSARAEDAPPEPEEPAPSPEAAVPSAEEAKQQAIGLFYEQCSVDPQSFDGQQAPTHWDMLLVLGYDAARILELAQTFDDDCDFVSFRSAILAANSAHQRTDTEPESKAKKDTRNRRDKVPTRRPTMKRPPRRRHVGRQSPTVRVVRHPHRPASM